MRLFALYLLGEYRLNLWANIKRLMLCSVLVAAVFFVVSMWPAFEGGHRSTYAAAQDDLMVNGPLTTKDLSEINAALGSGRLRAVHINIGAADQIQSPDSGRVTKNMIYRYERSEQEYLPQTYFSDQLLLKGSMRAPGAWAIDANTARLLHVDLGDKVRVVQVFTLPDESQHRFELTGTISAVYRPSKVLRGILMPFEPDIRPVFRAIEADYTNVFYTLASDPEDGASDVRALPQAVNWLVETSQRQREEAETAIRIGMGDSKSLTEGVLLAGAIAYAFYALLDEQRRFRKRSRTLAIACSLGCPASHQLIALAAEQSLYAVVSFGLGIWLGSTLEWVILKTYVPPGVYAAAAGWALSVNLTIIALTTLVVALRFSRLPLADLLTSE